MAAIFALSLVPAGALADPSTNHTSGDAELAADAYGSIKISNSRLNEAYDVYRIFDLASYTDEDSRTGHHIKDTEAYSYVINEMSWTGTTSRGTRTRQTPG